MYSFISLSTFVLSLASLVMSSNLHLSHHRPLAVHQVHAHAPNPSGLAVRHNVTERALQKRFDGCRFTYYDAGMGACGKVNSNADFIAALNSAQFAGGAHCFETITITVNGKTATAQITDQCPGCLFGGLDFSRGLFDFFASESAGVLTGSWTFGAGAPPPPPKPKTTSLPPATTAAPTTTSKAPETPSTLLSTSSAANSTVSALKSAGSTTPAAVPTSAPVDNLNMINLALVNIGAIGLAAKHT